VFTSTCFPLFDTLRGTVGLDIRLTMYENPGKLTSLTVQIFGDYGAVEVAKKTFSPALICSTEQCQWWVHLNADTTRVPADGRQEWRIRPNINEPDGKTMVGSTGYQTYLANGQPRNDYRATDLTEARGWYTNVGYTVARMDSNLPMKPVSGLWSFKVSLKPGAGGITVTHHVVLLDANLEADIPGTVLKEGSGEWSGTITLDTRALPNGRHRLLLRSDADAAAGSTNSGGLVLQFTVQNP
jgi:hypothetical protein